MKKALAILAALVIAAGCAKKEPEKPIRLYLPDVLVKYKEKEAPRMKKSDLKALSDAYKAVLTQSISKEERGPVLEFVSEKGPNEAEAYVLPLIFEKENKYYLYVRITSTKGSYSRELQPTLLSGPAEAGAKLNSSVPAALALFKEGLGVEQRALVFEDGPVITEEIKFDEILANVLRELGF